MPTSASRNGSINSTETFIGCTSLTVYEYIVQVRPSCRNIIMFALWSGSQRAGVLAQSSMSCIVLLSHHPPLPTTVGIHIVFLVAGLTLLVLLVKSTMLPQLATRSRKHDRVRARRQCKAECLDVYSILSRVLRVGTPGLRGEVGHPPNEFAQSQRVVPPALKLAPRYADSFAIRSAWVILRILQPQQALSTLSR